MATYQVGDLYNPNRQHWPEQTQWRFSPAGTELVMFYRSPQDGEVQAVKNGSVRFALLAGQHALLIAHRFGDLPWCDTPWQACRQRDETPGLPANPGGEGLLVSTVLVDADDGIIRAIRMVTWPARLVAAVREAIGTQIANGSTDEQGGVEIDAWYRRYPTTPKLVKAADMNVRA